MLVGEAIDFWRVEDLIEGERLLLHAEMKVPGDAWLEFRVRPLADCRQSELIQTAYFRPSPFWGRLYWHVLFPIHRMIFQGMARNMRERPNRRCAGQQLNRGYDPSWSPVRSAEKTPRLLLASMKAPG